MKTVLILTALVATAATAAPIVHGPPAAVAAVLAAEKQYSDNFSRVTVAQGMRDYIDPVDGLAFAGGDPVRGSDAAYAAFGGPNAPANLRLSWVPAEVFASTGGDMAATWGRFTMTDTTGKNPPFHGHYVTVWRKTAAGAWKAIMDIGEPDAPPEPAPRRRDADASRRHPCFRADDGVGPYIPPSAIAPCAAPVSGTTSPVRSLISAKRAATVSGVMSSGATWMPRVSVT